jgi:putative glutathione S-transferase
MGAVRTGAAGATPPSLALRGGNDGRCGGGGAPGAEGRDAGGCGTDARPSAGRAGAGRTGAGGGVLRGVLVDGAGPAAARGAPGVSDGRTETGPAAPGGPRGRRGGGGGSERAAPSRGGVGGSFLGELGSSLMRLAVFHKSRALGSPLSQGFYQPITSLPRLDSHSMPPDIQHMGRLIDGRWTTDDLKTDGHGRFLREATVFHGKVSRDGSSGFQAAPGRYHLYVSFACPWAHRTLILRELKGLTGVISVSVTEPVLSDQGWCFSERHPDELNGAGHLMDVYLKANPRYTGRVTVPVLWDRREQTIVCNDSRQIIRMLNAEFDDFAEHDVNLCPGGLRDEIDSLLDAMYAPVNDGVYRCGFAKTQLAYDEAVQTLFDALAGLDRRLQSQRYLCGSTLTEADVCLYTTLVRFDPVYHYHFKCNLRRIADYPALGPYLRDLYRIPAFRRTTDFDHIKRHYYMSHPTLNPSRIVPKGPAIELDAPHEREELSR